MSYRIVIVPVVTESGFRDKKTYEVQVHTEEDTFIKGGLFKKDRIETKHSWKTIATYDNIGEANKLLKEKMA
jgi:hypothetical protein